MQPNNVIFRAGSINKKSCIFLGTIDHILNNYAHMSNYSTGKPYQW